MPDHNFLGPQCLYLPLSRNEIANGHPPRLFHLDFQGLPCYLRAVLRLPWAVDLEHPLVPRCGQNRSGQQRRQNRCRHPSPFPPPSWARCSRRAPLSFIAFPKGFQRRRCPGPPYCFRLPLPGHEFLHHLNNLLRVTGRRHEKVILKHLLQFLPGQCPHGLLRSLHGVPPSSFLLWARSFFRIRCIRFWQDHSESPNRSAAAWCPSFSSATIRSSATSSGDKSAAAFSQSCPAYSRSSHCPS